MDKTIEKKIKEWINILPSYRIFKKVGRSDTLAFEIRTKEKGHNIPHVHVATMAASLSIAIETGEVLAQSGADARSVKEAQKWILDNQTFLKEKWNELADCPIKFEI